MAMSHPQPEDLKVSPSAPRMEAVGESGLLIRAPGKINLNLLVGPPGREGYHPIDSLVAKISLYDEIELRPRDDGGISFSCAGADCGPNEMNLALLAAERLTSRRDEAGGAGPFSRTDGLARGISVLRDSF